MPDVTMAQLASRPTLRDLVDASVSFTGIPDVGLAETSEAREAQDLRDLDLYRVNKPQPFYVRPHLCSSSPALD